MKILTLSHDALRAHNTEPLLLPAISVIAAGGFLHQSAALLRIGPKSWDSHLYLLLTVEQRGFMTRDYGFDALEQLTDRVPGDFDCFAYLGANGARGHWHNAENLWVSASWLGLVLDRITKPCTGTVLLKRLVAQAQEIAGAKKKKEGAK